MDLGKKKLTNKHDDQNGPSVFGKRANANRFTASLVFFGVATVVFAVVAVVTTEAEALGANEGGSWQLERFFVDNVCKVPYIREKC